MHDAFHGPALDRKCSCGMLTGSALETGYQPYCWCMKHVLGLYWPWLLCVDLLFASSSVFCTKIFPTEEKCTPIWHLHSTLPLSPVCSICLLAKHKILINCQLDINLYCKINKYPANCVDRLSVVLLSIHHHNCDLTWVCMWYFPVRVVCFDREGAAVLDRWAHASWATVASGHMRGENVTYHFEYALCVGVCVCYTEHSICPRIASLHWNARTRRRVKLTTWRNYSTAFSRKSTLNRSVLIEETWLEIGPEMYNMHTVQFAMW